MSEEKKEDDHGGEEEEEQEEEEQENSRIGEQRKVYGDASASPTNRKCHEQERKEGTGTDCAGHGLKGKEGA